MPYRVDKIKKEVLDMNKMNYLQYSTAIDIVANMTNVDNEVAIKTVGALCQIFDLQPEESLDDITKTLVNSLKKAGIFTEEEIEIVKNGETNEEIIDKIMNM
jgi:hypothetical protein